MAKKKVEKVEEIEIEREWFTDGCDFCMQFDYDDPHVIGASPDEKSRIELTLQAYSDPGLMFVCPTTGKKLRIFARPITDAGKKILESEKK